MANQDEAGLADELAIVLKAMAGERSAFEQIVRRTSRLVFAQLYLDTGDPHRADDLTQETFLLAWRNRKQLADPAGLRSWLLKIAQRAMLDAARHDGRKKRSGPASDMPLSLIPGRDDEPPDTLAHQETRQRVLDALRTLPAQYRMPLSLRYLAGCDYQTIGRQLGLSNGSLHGLLHRGLKQLRSALGDSE